MSEVMLVSGFIFALGITVLTLHQYTSDILYPVRNSSSGEIIAGTSANARAIKLNPKYAESPPYRPASLASQGRIAPDTRLVRVYREGATKPEGKWLMLKKDVEGLTAEQIQEKWALENTPTHMVDGDATELEARVGVAGKNFGKDGGGTQVELIGKGERATFTNPRPISSGGAN
jgi:hypothetical protein